MAQQELLQFTAHPCTGVGSIMVPKFCEYEVKNFVPLSAAGKSTQFFHLKFTEPGNRILAHPCTCQVPVKFLKRAI